MNLVVVDKCTNYCAYCFASTEMSKQSARAELSRDAIEPLIRFVRASGPQFDLNIIGGEPFLYRDLSYLLTRLYAEESFGNAPVFTGGIFSQRALDALAGFSDRVALLFNVNERRDYRRPADYDVVLRNIAYALDGGFRTTIGFNIWRDDFDYEEILSLCHRFGVEHLRWTVAYPEANPSPQVSVLAPASYPSVARRCAAFLEAAYSSGVEAYLDCPLPKCFFTTEELGRILLTQPASATNIKSCGPAIDVMPDLSVFRCYALCNEHRRKLADFRNLDELVAFYERNIDERYDRPRVYAACDSCEFADDRSCYGGCMAHSVSSVNKRRSVADIYRAAHDAVARGDTAAVARSLDELPRQDAPAALMRAHAAVAHGDRQAALHWARVAVNRSRTAASRAKGVALLQELGSTAADTTVVSCLSLDDAPRPPATFTLEFRRT